MPNKYRGALTPHTVYVSATNWQWAKTQPGGGASRYIDYVLTMHRRKDEAKRLRNQVKALLREKARLEGIVLQMGGDPNA